MQQEYQNCESSPKEDSNVDVVLDLSDNSGFYIQSALKEAELDIIKLDETIESINNLKPDCDTLDYALAASSGALCGLIDVFLVGKPGQSPLGDITDKWFDNRVRDFAKICGWKGSPKDPITFLEGKFKIPYDQRGCGDAGRIVFNLTPTNHHFKSLGHNPTLLGLFFSILDQFTNSSHFVSNGELIELVNANDKFELRGNSIPGKLWCGFVNWLGHLMSDVSGSSSSDGRGMGIPSPLWAWSNNIIVIKQKLGLQTSQFDKDFNELAIKLFEKGFDARFQTTQAIPVFINELTVRLLYLVRRLVKYYQNTPKETRSYNTMWTECKPYSNPTISRMLTVAHGTFCLVDVGDATIRGFVDGVGNFNPVEFFLRVNLIGVGRFTISLYGEAKREINYYDAKQNAKQASKEKTILNNYIEGLNILKEKYDDLKYLTFVEDLKKGNYQEAVNKTAILAKKRGAPHYDNIDEIKKNYFNHPKQ